MEIRDYQIGDEKQILDLFLEAFKKPISLEYWKWRFEDNPVKDIKIKLMWDKDVLAGHYAVSPVYMDIDGKKVLSALSMVTMTHPAYAGRGIFTDLAETLFRDEFEINGLSSVWGFPNNNSHYAFIKNLKWRNLEQIPNFSLKVEKLKKVSGGITRVAGSFTPEHVAAYNKVTSTFKVKVYKDMDFLNWRYMQNPINKYHVFEYKDGDTTHYAIVKLYHLAPMQVEVDLIELSFPANYDLLLQLFNDVVKYFEGKQIDKINSWIPLNHPIHLIMEKIGFQNDLPVTYSGLKLLDKQYVQMEDSKEWYYCMGDSDVY